MGGVVVCYYLSKNFNYWIIGIRILVKNMYEKDILLARLLTHITNEQIAL